MADSKFGTKIAFNLTPSSVDGLFDIEISMTTTVEDGSYTNSLRDTHLRNVKLGDAMEALKKRITEINLLLYGGKSPTPPDFN